VLSLRGNWMDGWVNIRSACVEGGGRKEESRGGFERER